MEIANQIFFLVFALLSLTFLLSYLWQFNFSKNELTNYNLLISIALYTLCCLCFALAPWINRFLLTIANVAYVAANIALVILYANWNNQQFSRRAIDGSPIPGWLKFNPDTKTFSADKAPEGLQSLQVKVQTMQGDNVVGETTLTLNTK